MKRAIFYKIGDKEKREIEMEFDDSGCECQGDALQAKKVETFGRKVDEYVLTAIEEDFV